MRTLALSLALAVALVALPYQSRAQAATEFVVWPAQYSYGTPSGAFTWNSTVLGLRFTSGIAPHFGLGAGLYYGSVANFAGPGPINGWTGNTLAGDLSLRFGTSVGLVDLRAFGGYQAFGLAANGSTPSDRLLLQTSGFRTGADVRFHLANGLVLRGGLTILPSLNSSETLSVSTPPPPPPAQWNGSGSGTEYEVGLGYSLLNFSAFVGYRSGNYQTNWSGGGGSSSTTFSGYVFSLETRF